MRNVVAFNLAKVTPRDSLFFKGLADEFKRQKTSFVLFTPQRQDNMEAFSKPFDWVIANIAKSYPLEKVVLRHQLTDEQRAKWSERVAMLSLQDDTLSPAGMVDILERFANYVLETFRPQVVLSWNTLCPHSGVLGDLARGLGINVYMMERAFLDNSWFLEEGGLVGHSALVDTPLDALIAGREEECRLVGRTYLSADPFHAMLRYQQKQGTRFREILKAAAAAQRPTLAFLPPDDLSLGFKPVDNDDRRQHLPHYESSVEAAIALAEAVPHCDVIFKPHPSFREMVLPEKLRDNLFVVDHDYRDVIAGTDAMVSSGTGLVTNALAIGKPVIQMNRDQFLNKGITYEALDPTAIANAVAAALEKRDLAARLERFEMFIGYCLRYYLVSLPDADASFRRPGDAARWIVSQNFGAPAPPTPSDVAQPSTSRTELFRTLRSEPDATLLVDLDHTLLFANTTEAFLDTLRPRILFVMIHWLISWLISGPKLAERGISKNQVFDPMRVFWSAILAPWSLLAWRSRARQLVAERGNWVLIEALLKAGLDRLVIVTNGHPWLVRPVVSAMGLDRAVLVCGDVRAGPGDIRQVGKISAISRRVPGFTPGKCIAISDSRDDIQMLTRTQRGYLIDWGDPKTKADPLSRYFPFVLTAEGKYPGARVVRRHRFQEDLPVIVLAFVFAGLGLQTLLALIADPVTAGLALVWMVAVKLAAVLLLFLSFNAVYEIGYWDNDFVASKGEAQPNVSKAMEKFRAYPIRQGAWRWGLGLGLFGTLLLALCRNADNGMLAPLPESGAWAGDIALRWAVAFALWFAGLLVSRRVFNLHNSLPETARIYSFYLLHVLKLLIYALLLPIGLAGVVLIMAQVYRHWVGYVVYRFKGRKDDIPRMQMRGFFFLVLSAMLALATPTAALFDLTWILGALLFLTGQHRFRWPIAR
ncbi:haloacid dehalogenase-like hydrolase [Xanthobacter agilis]|uniref:haloacid dehalogenase-like hydrolase n=1 Tax=Xanthobacter agilis TaxID=47492 RepID=UPI003726AA2A